MCSLPEDSLFCLSGRATHNNLACREVHLVQRFSGDVPEIVNSLSVDDLMQEKERNWY